jgi:hypothetical protein
LHNSSTIKAYETSSEARRKAQLKTEETIADLKMLHGFSINDDESVLPPELQLEIESIQKTNYALIEQTESYEQNLITESESNETKIRVNEMLAELHEQIKLVDRFKEDIDSGILKEKEKIIKAKQEFKSCLEEINENISLLPFNAKKMDFVENKQDVNDIDNVQTIGEMKIKETFGFKKMYLFNFNDHEDSKSFTHPSRLFEMLDNGTYVVGGFVSKTQKFHLFIYDPIMKTKSREVIFNKRIDELFSFKNKIAFSLRKTEQYGYNYVLKIMDENLNLIKEIDTLCLLKNVDESNLYCIFWRRLEVFDWNLNEIKTDVLFQNTDSKQSFYLEKLSIINQFFKRDNKYILNYKSGDYYETDELLIFSESGALLKKKFILGEFVMDSNNNIIVNNKKNNLIEYYDLNADLLKTVSYSRPKSAQKRLVKQIKINSADNVYFGQ